MVVAVEPEAVERGWRSSEHHGRPTGNRVISWGLMEGAALLCASARPPQFVLLLGACFIVLSHVEPRHVYVEGTQA